MSTRGLEKFLNWMNSMSDFRTMCKRMSAVKRAQSAVSASSIIMCSYSYELYEVSASVPRLLGRGPSARGRESSALAGSGMRWRVRTRSRAAARSALLVVVCAAASSILFVAPISVHLVCVAVGALGIELEVVPRLALLAFLVLVRTARSGLLRFPVLALVVLLPLRTARLLLLLLLLIYSHCLTAICAHQYRVCSTTITWTVRVHRKSIVNLSELNHNSQI